MKFTPETSRNLIPYVVLFAGLLFTALVYYSLTAIGGEEDKAQFNASVQEVEAGIRSRIETYEALLAATSGLYAASDKVTEADFRHFVDRMQIRKRYPGVLGIGFSKRLSAAEKESFLQARRKEGFANFRIWPENERDEYHSITYLEPLDERNKRALGYDMFTEPVRRAAMEQARDSGEEAASRGVRLVQETEPEQAGFLIYVPVYQNGSDTTSVSKRREALVGFVYSPIRVNDFLAGVLRADNADTNFHVLDGPDPSANLIYDSTANAPGDQNHRPHLTDSRSIEIGGQQWMLSFSNGPTLDRASGKRFAYYALGGGLLISLLFFVVTRAQMHARSLAETAAAELRSSEAIVRKTLADHERAETALRESEERYRELVENANDIVYTVDLDGKVSSVNKAGELITGFPRDELVGKDLSEILSDASTEVSRRMLDRKLAGEERTNFEVDLRAKSGSLVTVEISSRLVLKDGQPFGVQGIARDITLRRRAEEALRQADQRALSEYERLLERIATLSQALGTARRLTAIFKALTDFAIVSAPCDGLFVSLYDSGEDTRTACFAWGDGQEMDVTSLPPMPVNTLGPNGRAIRSGEVVITNDYMSATRGHPSVIVGPENGLRPESSMALPMTVMGRIVGTIEIQSYERAAYREGHVTAMGMAANLTAVAIENVRLLERESSARAAAEESNRLKDEFLATVSHELRTPLTAILGWSRMLEGGGLDPAATERAIQTIWRNAKSQSQIIDDILDVSRIITGNLYLDLQPIELAPVIESAINVVRPTAEAKNIRIDVDFETHPTVISGDAHRLQQVIWNLLSNAIKFTAAEGRVLISLRQLDSQAEISVLDTGQGINRDFLPFVFDRFRQADSTTTRQHGGLGLGLAIARHLVEIHGGTIHAQSEGKGRGSTFSVRLPLLRTVGTSRGVNRDEIAVPTLGHQLAGLHVLLVDDDKDTLDLLTTALTQYDARVTAVASAGEAWAALQTFEPDVLVSDIAMPGSDGYELIKQIRSSTSENCNVPAVAITAYAKEEDRVRALASGFQRYLAKPVELQELISAVADATKKTNNPV